jgi:type III secretion protein HrpB1
MKRVTNDRNRGLNRSPCDRGEIVEGMLGVLWAGAQLDLPGDLRVLEDLLDAIGVMQPEMDEDRVALAWWHVRARAWSDALVELRRTERSGALSSLGTALMAVCLFALKDPTWRTYAYAAAYQSDNALATKTALALLAAPEIEPFGGDVE